MAQPRSRTSGTLPRMFGPSRRNNDDDDSGMHSDSSMPSLQTVSDSDDDGQPFSDNDSDSDYISDDNEGDEGDSLDEQLPRLVPTSDRDAGRSIPRVPPGPPWRHQPPGAHMYTYEDIEGEDEDDGVNENVGPSQGNLGASLLRALVGMDMDVPPPGPPFSATNPVLRSILGAIQSSQGHSRFMYEYVRDMPAPPDMDPQRADTIIAALERVPKELISRYEKLRSGHGEEDCDGCPICRESLSDSPDEAVEDVYLTLLAELPFPQVRHDAILAFPCPGKHVFHETCLSPWLARKTTCPSCRFDVDPHSLTLRVDYLPRPIGSGRRRTVVRPKWQPPQVKPFREWLDDEENKSSDPLPIPPRAQVSPGGSRVVTVDPVALALPVEGEEEEESDGAWVTDDDEFEEEYEDDEGQHDMNPPPVSFGLPNRPFRVANFWGAPDDDTDSPVVGDLDDPSYIAERRRFLRGLMDPSNPLQLFLGDDVDMPTLVPTRERTRAEPNYDADEDSDEDGPPPLMDEPSHVRHVRHPVSFFSRDEGLISIPHLGLQAVVDDDDDLPHLVGEPEPESATSPGYESWPRLDRVDFAQWFNRSDEVAPVEVDDVD